MSNGMAQPVIMLGCQRSGTTYLAKVLGLHEKGFFWSEATFFRYVVLFFWNLIRDRASFRQPRFMEVLHMLKAPRGMPINEHGEKILASFERSLLRYFDDGRLEEWANKGQKREFLQTLSYDTLTLGASEVAYWGDKYPEYLFQIPELVKIFPEAKFIFVIRNPYAVAESLVRHLNPKDKIAGGMRFSLKDCWDQWFDWNRVWLENYERIPAENRFVIRYEKFLLDTFRVMKELSAFMGVDLLASPGIANELKAIQPHNLDKWKKTRFYGQLVQMRVEPEQTKVFDYYGGL